VKSWLRLLSDCDVDLEKYGETENYMREDHAADWNMNMYLSGYWERREVTEIWIGETADDFRIELEDLYFTTDLVADFWGWVEAPSDEYLKVQEVSGAWPED